MIRSFTGPAYFLCKLGGSAGLKAAKTFSVILALVPYYRIKGGKSGYLQEIAYYTSFDNRLYRIDTFQEIH